MTVRNASASGRSCTARRFGVLARTLIFLLTASSGYANSEQTALGEPVPAGSDQRAAIVALEGYNQALIEGDYVTLRDRFLHVPFVVLDGAPRVIPSVETVVAGLRMTRESLDAASYGTTKMEPPRVSSLANDRLLLYSRLHHLRKDGSLLAERANFYVMVRVAGVWKVGGIIPQDAALAER